MNKFFAVFSLLVVTAILGAALGANIAQAHSQPAAAPITSTFDEVIGKPLTDQAVADFVLSNDCSASGTFLLCEDAGMALRVDANQLVDTVFLYPNGGNGFEAFQGELPFRLAAGDTMASVEAKMSSPKVPQAPQLGRNPGLPDAGGSPDHVTYWAVYKRFGFTVVYNTPVASDKGATINAILVSK